MISKFELFKDIETLKDIFQDLELDYPGTELQITGDLVPAALFKLYITETKLDLQYANDLVSYIGKCRDFGFDVQNFAEIVYGNPLPFHSSHLHYVMAEGNDKTWLESGEKFLNQLDKNIRCRFTNFKFDPRNVRSIRLKIYKPTKK